MGYADMCITLDGLDSTIRSRTVALHACSFSRPKRVSMRPHKASDAYAYHVRVGGHVGVVCIQDKTSDDAEYDSWLLLEKVERSAPTSPEKGGGEEWGYSYFQLDVCFRW